MHDQRRVMGGDRYPGYDVLAKWSGPSWNAKTRQVIARRLAIAPEPRFFTAAEFETVTAIAARIVPQPAARPPIPVAALVDLKLHEGVMDGYRSAGTPRDGEAWRLGLKALDAEARMAYRDRFAALADGLQVTLLQRAEAGDLHASEWGAMSPRDFFKKRLARDIVLAYYAHPIAWSEIGWGGPASPRGYVRLDFNERDPWEAAEAHGDDASARRMNSRVR
ncbi:MAG TPA: gluconate 2-dehydrogenase subunit 3 family protein [Bradyrhizobium sp.]|nr:gluconate 2-dehydrogenase subunit 3 family protein [Bradyrhizobium sp.]